MAAAASRVPSAELATDDQLALGAPVGVHVCAKAGLTAVSTRALPAAINALDLEIIISRLMRTRGALREVVARASCPPYRLADAGEPLLEPEHGPFQPII